jgi:hypothetical protein
MQGDPRTTDMTIVPETIDVPETVPRIAAAPANSGCLGNRLIGVASADDRSEARAAEGGAP